MSRRKTVFDTNIWIRLTTEQKEEAVKLARESGVTMSEYIRRAICGHVPPPLPAADLTETADLLRETSLSIQREINAAIAAGNDPGKLQGWRADTEEAAGRLIAAGYADG